MKKKIACFVLASLTVLSLVGAPALVTAEEPVPPNLQEDKEHLEQLEGQITNIADGLDRVEKNIVATKVKQAELKKQVEATAGESGALVARVDAKTREYQRKLENLKAAILADYQDPHEDMMRLLLESGSLSQTARRDQYASSVATKLETLATDAQDVQTDLQDRKRELDGKRSTLEMLHRQISLLSQSLEQQQRDMRELQANRANEAAFLSARVAQQEAVESALLGVSGDGNALWGAYRDIAAVKRGDVIGFEGTTGFSTGCHLHFSVIKDGQWVDPMPFIGAGMLLMPGGDITQVYGMTAWARTGAYNGKIHNGLDMGQGCGAPIRAAADGVIVRDNRSDGSGFGHYMVIRHAGGMMTLYGHMI